MATKVFGVGVDIAHIPRFADCFARHGERFLRRAFHPSEVAEFRSKPAAAQPGFLASRWAVKEATYKAFQRYRVLFPEIRLVKQSPSDNDSASAADAKIFTPVQTKLSVAESSQALRLEFNGETLALAEQLSLVDPHVSISHDKDYAIAYVVLQQKA
ncbi:hypothetical protein Gpo141_00000314 [Globisporangium polare]